MSGGQIGPSTAESEIKEAGPCVCNKLDRRRRMLIDMDVHTDPTSSLPVKEDKKQESQEKIVFCPAKNQIWPIIRDTKTFFFICFK